MSIRIQKGFDKEKKTAPLLAEFAVKDYHRHTFGLAEKPIDARLKFQGREIV
jgi:hypothetical protein